MQLRILVLTVMSIVLGATASARAENPEDVRRLLETGYCPACDLSNANLRGANLVHADLNGAILIGADLSNAVLRRANLRNAILNAANLSGTDLRFANLSNASLQGARILQPADLTGANLEGTIMPNGVFSRPLEEPRSDSTGSTGTSTGASPGTSTGAIAPNPTAVPPTTAPVP